MKNIIDFVKRNILWLIGGFLALIILEPELAEIKTLLLIIISECLAIALSGLAQFVYTKIDFIRENAVSSLGMIFIGVHILCGLTILGVYIAQFCN
jgi:hypothetical protein